MRRLAVGLRALLAAVLALAVMLAATGWLYLVYPHVSLPGPLIRRRPAARRAVEALDRAAAVLRRDLGRRGAPARRARAVRTRRAADCGAPLGLAVAGWSYLANGVSLLVVRQVTAHQALTDAAQLRATWIPAVLAALGGALLGRGRASARSRAPLLLACFVAAARPAGALGCDRARARALADAARSGPGAAADERARRSTRRRARLCGARTRARAPARLAARARAARRLDRAPPPASLRPRCRRDRHAHGCARRLARPLRSTRRSGRAPAHPGPGRGLRRRDLRLRVRGDLAQPARRRPAVHARLRAARDRSRAGRARPPRRGSPEWRLPRLVRDLGLRPGPSGRSRAACGLARTVALPARPPRRRPRAGAFARRVLGGRHARAVRAPRRQVVFLQRG